MEQETEPQEQVLTEAQKIAVKFLRANSTLADLYRKYGDPGEEPYVSIAFTDDYKEKLTMYVKVVRELEVR